MEQSAATCSTDVDAFALDALANNGRVVVAMSGGVDSSVVAALLHREGHQVVGISMRLYGKVTAEIGKSCCSPDDLNDARDVAAQLGFPFYVANYQEAFRRMVVDYFVDEYRRGRTPSPCVLCNDHLKFDALLQRMESLGAAFLATGHYARIEERDGRFALLRGRDSIKDQSYFLFGLRRASLARIRFPLGEMTKPEVRLLAQEMGVPTALKRESQDICFVGSGDYAQFVRARLADEEVKRGRIVRPSTGEEFGEHEGIHAFTVGQRKGIGVAYKEPLYVLGSDAETGDLFVGSAEELACAGFTMDRLNFLAWAEAPPVFDCLVQVRYRHKPVAARVVLSEDGLRARVELASSERGIAPGQAAVFYDGDEVLGGGWIVRSF